MVDTYTVKAGDTLSGIAQRHLGRASRWPQIYAYNVKHRGRTGPALRDPDKLHIGQRILLPPKHAASPPHLPLHRAFAHPRQATKPLVQPAVKPATAPGAAPAAAPPSPRALPPAAEGRTHINSFAYKYNLDLLPPIKGETADFEFESKFTGQIYIWADKQIDLLTYGNSGVELAAKHETDTALGKLVNSGKVTWDPKSNKVTYENLMTTNAAGAPPNFVGVGVVMDSTNPMPAVRVKFTSPKLAGRLPPTILYLAESLTITLDVRPKPRPPAGPDAVADRNFATIPAPARNFATIAPPQAQPGAVVATAAGSDKPWWDRPSILIPGAAILVLATLASNVVTWGADAEVDPASFSAAGAMMTRALAH